MSEKSEAFGLGFDGDDEVRKQGKCYQGEIEQLEAELGQGHHILDEATPEGRRLASSQREAIEIAQTIRTTDGLVRLSLPPGLPLADLVMGAEGSGVIGDNSVLAYAVQDKGHGGLTPRRPYKTH
jgi:hypothetical protein